VTPDIAVPDYAGGSLLNLVAEIEARLGGDPPAPRLAPDRAAAIPQAATYVLVLFDGLGDHQLDHPGAARLLRDRVDVIDAPFPTTTTVSLATIATGTAPATHGLIGYQLWLPDMRRVVNTIRWTTLWGDAIEFDPARFLPAPNLWERLGTVGAEGFTVQPANFERSALSRVLYRGCGFAGVSDLDEWARVAADLAAVPGRVILAYLPQVDFAAHVHGQSSPEYAAALQFVATAWKRLAELLPENAIAVGTADHGHIDFPQSHQHLIDKATQADRILYGDGRVMFVKGDGEGLADALPAEWIPRAAMQSWWGPGADSRGFDDRAPDGVLVADEESLLLHRFSDDRMVGNHGGLTARERHVPLLIARNGVS